MNSESLTNSFRGILKADEMESKEVKFFDLNNLPAEIIPTNMPILNDLKNKVDSYI